jgi:hypothetical protein
MWVFMGVCAFCGDETSNVSRPMAGHMRNWAHRNAQRAHTTREIRIMPSSGYPIPHEQHRPQILKYPVVFPDFFVDKKNPL